MSPVFIYTIAFLLGMTFVILAFPFQSPMLANLGVLLWIPLLSWFALRIGDHINSKDPK